MYKQLSAILIASILALSTTAIAFASSDDDDDEIKGPINGQVVLNKLTEEYVRVITPANAYLTFQSDE